MKILRRSWSFFTYPGVLLLLGLGFALVPLAQGELFFYWDNAQGHYPRTVFLHQALRSGEIPHWWPQAGSGVPTVAEGQAAHYHPIRLLLALLFSPPVAFMTEIGLYLAVAGLSTYFFLREFRLQGSACLIGGLCQMFGSFSVIFIRNMALHRSFFLLPLAMLLAERFATRQKFSYGLAASLIIGLQLLAGHPAFATVTIVATTVYILCRVVQRCWHAQETFRLTVCSLARATVCWGVSVVLAVGISAIQFIPTLLHVEQSIRQGGLDFKYAVVAQLPAEIKYLPQLFFPYVYYQGDWLETPTWWGSYFNVVPNMGVYIGTLPVLLAFMALWWRRRWPDPGWPLTGCCLVATGFALGAATPLYPALWSLPGMNGMRFPSRFLMWTSFCLSCLAALGLNRLLTRSRLASPQRRDILPFSLLGILVLLMALFFWTQTTPIASVVRIAQDFQSGLVTSLLLFAIAFSLAGSVLLMRGRCRGVLVAGSVLFVLFDLWLFRVRSGYAPTVSVREVMTPPSLVKFLKSDQDRFRVMSLVVVDGSLNRNEDLFEFLQADACAIWGIESTDVYYALELKRYYAVRKAVLWELLNSPEAAEKLAGFLGALNVKYVVAPQPVILAGWKKVHQTARASAWKNPAFLPRAFLVGSILPEKIEIRPEWSLKADYLRLGTYRDMVSNWWTRKEDAQIVDNLMSFPINYHTTAVVAGNHLPELSGLAPESEVRVLSEQADMMKFNVQTSKQTFLAISSNYYPGWSATVNGKPTQLYRTNYVGMGVLVPAGQSEVVLRFVTPGFRLGAFVTLASLGVLLGGLIVIWKFKLTILWDITPRLVKDRPFGSSHTYERSSADPSLEYRVTNINRERAG